ncbi:DNA adenine methylase [Acidithiobacillus ferriphilus]|uniref:DNA adenine methylase n=1 Tax=Acidithiobacillus ferriphilus TaxID=1689834 RepID=UPI001C06C165|nr:DNA adenine methylase [Acidithiobacillus ferriphilus]MBU2852911.1 DNA adenine methylase [Acidithiobacillus ferriphilus]
MNVTPAFAWMGGKNRVRDRIVPYTVGASLYVEPFAGALNVLLARPWQGATPAKDMEVVNDRDERIVNFYRVLQDDLLRDRLMQKLKYTPYARSEFGRALQVLRDPASGSVDRAWAFFVAQNQGISGGGCNASNENNWGTSKERDTASRFRWHVQELEGLAERLAGVIIENRDALQLLSTWDAPHAVFYCDPPYVPATRKMSDHRSRYQEEMGLDDHHALIDALLCMKGQAILSGYRDEAVHGPLEAAGWQRIDTKVSLHASVQDKTQTRTECLWLSPGIQNQQMGLFA